MSADVVGTDQTSNRIDVAAKPTGQPVESGWRVLGEANASSTNAPTTETAAGMIPGRARRRTAFERVSMRVLSTGGVIGLATALGAVLGAQDVAGWVIGLAVGLTSVVLAAVLWSSRQV